MDRRHSAVPIICVCTSKGYGGADPVNFTDPTGMFGRRFTEFPVSVRYRGRGSGYCSNFTLSGALTAALSV